MEQEDSLPAGVGGSGREGAHHAVGSFLFPFRGRRRLVRWVVGTVLVALLPISFVVVFGYAVECIRRAAADAQAAPPAWRFRGRLLLDGVWTAAQGAVLTAPFATLAWLVAAGLGQVWHPTGDSFVDAAEAWVLSVLVAALPWGMVMLTVLPPTLARFAVSGRPADLAALPAVVEVVRWRFPDWNAAVVAITTAWLLAAAGLALAVIGVVPGAFYAILVSSHACAALSPDRTNG